MSANVMAENVADCYAAVKAQSYAAMCYAPDMDTIGERLRWARSKKFKSAAAAARAHPRMHEQNVRDHEADRRGLDADQVVIYAKKYGVPKAWLMWGDEGEPPRKINVLGYVGAGAEIFTFDDHAMGAGLEEIDAPPGSSEDAVAVIVRGDSQSPIYEDGDVLVYSRQLPPDEMIGRRSVVGLPDGRRFVKTILPGVEGQFTLSSANASPMLNIPVEWAAPIDWVKPK